MTFPTRPWYAGRSCGNPLAVMKQLGRDLLKASGMERVGEPTTGCLRSFPPGIEHQAPTYE